ncbi:MAG: hypothetical protein JJU29_08975 [Verrucomicrobia bacterium]|nr:hypothetical protein [Verrucomicrobiota bacterium]MCH8511403.1 type II restriction endonuclease [Kiritimatiellia bacterium]
MKRIRQNLKDLVSSLTPVEATWLDEHAAGCIGVLRGIPQKPAFDRTDVLNILESDFALGMTVIRLFLDVSKDEMTMQMKEILGPGGFGITRFHQERDKFLSALESMGVLEKMSAAVNVKAHWSDVLVERLKGGRGSAIKGQQRGRGLEDFTEKLLLKVFHPDLVDTRCRFVGVNGTSTEKADFAVPNRNDPQLLIEVKAYGATGSKQTDILGDIARIVEQKRPDTVMMLVTDGMTWKERLSDLRKLVELQNQGKIFRIYTRSMQSDFLKDLRTLKSELGLPE